MYLIKYTENGRKTGIGTKQGRRREEAYQKEQAKQRADAARLAATEADTLGGYALEAAEKAYSIHQSWLRAARRAQQLAAMAGGMYSKV